MNVCFRDVGRWVVSLLARQQCMCGGWRGACVCVVGKIILESCQDYSRRVTPSGSWRAVCFISIHQNAEKEPLSISLCLSLLCVLIMGTTFENKRIKTNTHTFCCMRSAQICCLCMRADHVWNALATDGRWRRRVASGRIVFANGSLAGYHFCAAIFQRVIMNLQQYERAHTQNTQLQSMMQTVPAPDRVHVPRKRLSGCDCARQINTLIKRRLFPRRRRI